jgi:DNA repair protein RecN (Recombination protein N)
MLVELSIRDIVLIDKLTLGFEAGLGVLTGETGAGKSILLDAFALALGARGDGSLVRHGENQGQVTAVFSVPADHPSARLLQAQDIAFEGEIILRRIQFADGRTRALVNDQAVSVQALKAIGATLVEIHGQHDDRALTDPASHRDLLDAFAKNRSLVAKAATAFATFRTARDQLNTHEAYIEKVRKEADFLRHAAGELNKLAPQEGEETDLATRRQTMMGSEKIATEINDALDALSGDSSPIPVLSSVMRRLERRSRDVPQLINPSLQALGQALDAVDRARQTIEEAQRATEFNPRDLEHVEERLFALRAAGRKYNVMVDDLAALAVRFDADLSAIDAGEADLVRLQQAVKDSEQVFLAAADALSKSRHAAAKKLEEAVGSELPPLKLERARFIVMVESDREQRHAAGFDRVEFWVETNPGTKPGPLMKVASGGELSRFMLALKVRLADRGSTPTLVFDEIDTGVGGAVADAIGQRLARLAGQVQVLAVTHAPQVAAKAGNHYLISKAMDKGRVATRVDLLADDPRCEELARMLSGAEITQEARAAARRLLTNAAGART